MRVPLKIVLAAALLANAPGAEAQMRNQGSESENRTNRQELNSTSAVDRDARKSTTWKTAYERGVEEGQSAGRQDYQRRQMWDLEGQTELERADSGYTPRMGPFGVYQAGYREGFRGAYRMGFNNARDGR